MNGTITISQLIRLADYVLMYKQRQGGCVVTSAVIAMCYHMPIERMQGRPRLADIGDVLQAHGFPRTAGPAHLNANTWTAIAVILTQLGVEREHWPIYVRVMLGEIV